MINPSITISKVDSLLETLSNKGQGNDFIKVKSILSELYLSMTSIETKWITRIILKNLHLSIEPKIYFDSFHGW